MEETPQISLAHLSQQSGVPRSTCHKIIKHRLYLHPYEYCSWFPNHINYGHLLDVSFFSDDAFRIRYLSEFQNLECS
jgi:hypothetical protein